MEAPIDPLALAKLEEPKLELLPEDLGNACDGQLEYHASCDSFFLFYNTKYDDGLPEGEHHPRTRFSVAHELGHFFLEHHRAYLMQGGKTHGSVNEFSSENIMEREADAFAAGLLMPSELLNQVVNREELSLERIRDIASQFQTSFVSTAIRCVQHSDFPCEVVGIREGEVAWRFRPAKGRDPLHEGKLYRLPNGPLSSSQAVKKWEQFQLGICGEETLPGKPDEWFKTYGPAERDLVVWESYLPVLSLNTMVVLLTISESDLFDNT